MKMKGKIRLATKKDSKTILDLLNSSTELTGDSSQNYTKEMIKEYLSNKNYIILIYESNKRIIGLLIAEIWKIAKYSYLFNIIIKKEFRRKGIAIQLIKKFEELSKKYKSKLIYLHAHKNNLKMLNLLKKINYKKGKENIYYSKILKW
ncbi:GNAT family N-acetyltransferase [Candidatus Pacearchaeota archaeon]|nr:GNAT family N-acetyltransferase [Candidatus Pacearchaeota archaeon]